MYVYILLYILLLLVSPDGTNELVITYIQVTLIDHRVQLIPLCAALPILLMAQLIYCHPTLRAHGRIWCACGLHAGHPQVLA